MKNAAIALAVLTLTLAACGGKADMPTAEQVAKAYEMHMNANLVPELGQRIEIRGWDDLEVEISGVIDRLEMDSQGRPYVVDLKTGRRAPTQEELLRLPQLAAYQVALRAEGLVRLLEAEETDPALREALAELARPSSPGGAALVQLGAGTQRTKVQEQPPLTDEDVWALQDVFAAARRTVGPRFLAVHGPGTRCALPSVCPLCSEGRQVTEWPR